MMQDGLCQHKMLRSVGNEKLSQCGKWSLCCSFARQTFIDGGDLVPASDHGHTILDCGMCISLASLYAVTFIDFRSSSCNISPGDAGFKSIILVTSLMIISNFFNDHVSVIPMETDPIQTLKKPALWSLPLNHSKYPWATYFILQRAKQLILPKENNTQVLLLMDIYKRYS